MHIINKARLETSIVLKNHINNLTSKCITPYILLDKLNRVWLLQMSIWHFTVSIWYSAIEKD